MKIKRNAKCEKISHWSQCPYSVFENFTQILKHFGLGFSIGLHGPKNKERNNNKKKKPICTCIHWDVTFKHWKVGLFTRHINHLHHPALTAYVHGTWKIVLTKAIPLIPVYIQSISSASLKHLKVVTVASHYADIFIITHFSSSSYCQSHQAFFPCSAWSW